MSHDIKLSTRDTIIIRFALKYFIDHSGASEEEKIQAEELYHAIDQIVDMDINDEHKRFREKVLKRVGAIRKK